jgi:hypothetical protein
MRKQTLHTTPTDNQIKNLCHSVCPDHTVIYRRCCLEAYWYEVTNVQKNVYEE